MNDDNIAIELVASFQRHHRSASSELLSILSYSFQAAPSVKVLHQRSDFERHYLRIVTRVWIKDSIEVRHRSQKEFFSGSEFVSDEIRTQSEPLMVPMK
jgi:hypothetical protein